LNIETPAGSLASLATSLWWSYNWRQAHVNCCPVCMCASAHQPQDTAAELRIPCAMVPRGLPLLPASDKRVMCEGYRWGNGCCCCCRMSALQTSPRAAQQKL
jgi:hypothetical protein